MRVYELENGEDYHKRKQKVVFLNVNKMSLLRTFCVANANLSWELSPFGGISRRGHRIGETQFFLCLSKKRWIMSYSMALSLWLLLYHKRKRNRWKSWNMLNETRLGHYNGTIKSTLKWYQMANLLFSFFWSEMRTCNASTIPHIVYSSSSYVLISRLWFK